MPENNENLEEHSSKQEFINNLEHSNEEVSEIVKLFREQGLKNREPISLKNLFYEGEISKEELVLMPKGNNIKNEMQKVIYDFVIMNNIPTEDVISVQRELRDEMMKQLRTNLHTIQNIGLIPSFADVENSPGFLAKDISTSDILKISKGHQEKTNKMFLRAISRKNGSDKEIIPLSENIKELIENNSIKTLDDLKYALAKDEEFRKNKKSRRYYKNAFRRASDGEFINMLKNLGLEDADHKLNKKTMPNVLASWSRKVTNAYHLVEGMLDNLDKLSLSYNLDKIQSIDKTQWNSLVNMNMLELINLVDEDTYIEASAEKKYFAQLGVYMSYLMNYIKRYKPYEEADNAWKRWNEYILYEKNGKELNILNNDSGDIYFEDMLVSNESMKVYDKLDLADFSFENRNGEESNIEGVFIGKGRKEILPIVQKLMSQNDISKLEDIFDFARAKIMVNYTASEIHNTEGLEDKLVDMAKNLVGEQYFGLEFVDIKDRSKLKKGEFLVSNKLVSNKENKNSNGYSALKVYGVDEDGVNIEMQIIPKNTYISESNLHSPESHASYEKRRTLSLIRDLLPKSLFKGVHEEIENVNDAMKQEENLFKSRYNLLLK